MSKHDNTPKELTQKVIAYGRYRFRRYQALDDALCIYFHMHDVKSWVTVTDICIGLDMDEQNHATRKRVARICHALKRINRVEIKNRGKGHGPFAPLFIRALE